MIAAVIRSALVDEALQAGCAHVWKMRRRLQRLEERGAKKRKLALEAMCEVGLKKLEQPDFTASARAGFPLSSSPKTSFLRITGYRSHPSSIANPSLPTSNGAR